MCIRDRTNSHRIIQLVSTLGQDLADGELLQLSNVSNHSFSEEKMCIRDRLSCGYADRHRNSSSCEQALVDSLEVRVQDSLFSNVHYSCLLYTSYE